MEHKYHHTKPGANQADSNAGQHAEPGPARLGRLVAKVRKQSGLSQRQLARDAGLDIATLSRVEQGFYASPTPTTLRRLAETLDIGLVELYRAAGYVRAHDLLGVADEIAIECGLTDETANLLRANYRAYLARAHGLQAYTTAAT